MCAGTLAPHGRWLLVLVLGMALVLVACDFGASPRSPTGTVRVIPSGGGDPEDLSCLGLSVQFAPGDGCGISRVTLVGKNACAQAWTVKSVASPALSVDGGTGTPLNESFAPGAPISIPLALGGSLDWGLHTTMGAAEYIVRVTAEPLGC